MLQNELKEKLKKAKYQNKITLVAAGVCLAAAITFGVLYLLNLPHEVITPAEDAMSSQMESPALDQLEEDESIVLTQKVDSLSIVIDTLENRLARTNEELDKFSNGSVSSAYTVDHISQLIENAKAFTETNCNKSLAFLYAAKKVSQMDGTTDANKEAINLMINKCEEDLFGKKPGSDSPTSSIND